MELAGFLVTLRTRGFAVEPEGHPGGVFLFFCSRLGCLGSLAVSLLLTLVLLLVFDVL